MKQIAVIVIIVHIANLAISQPKWNLSLAAGTTLQKGNVNKFDVRSSGEIGVTDSLYSLSAYFKGVYGELKNIENAREISGGVKYDYKPQHRISPFLALEIYSNKFKGIDIKSYYLAGVKYRFYQNESADISISSAAVYDFTQYTPPSDNTEIQKPNTTIIRLSVRPKIKFQIGKNMSFMHITFVQPDITNFSDYIVDSKTTLSNKITKAISLDITFDYSYYSVLPSTKFQNSDYAAYLTLKVKI